VKSTPTSAPVSSVLRIVSWGLPLMLAMLPIGLLSVYSYQIASESVRDIIRAEDLSATGGIGILLQEDLGKTVALAEAFAATTGTMKALEDDDTFHSRLA